MNKHVHRLVFDRRRGMRVPAHEHARTASKAAGGQTRAVALVGALTLVGLSTIAQAQMRSDGAVAGTAVSRAQGAMTVTPAARPVSALVRDALANPRANLPTYSAGNWSLNTGNYQDPSLSNDGKIMTLVQNGTTIVLNWDSFDIGQGYQVRFVQPTGGRALNRVASLTPSVIDGVLSANGEVMLENTAGVIFGNNARVDTRSFVATALKISSEAFETGIRAFRKGEASFGGDNSAIHGFISVEKGAEIRSLPGGDVILVAPRVVNQGLIETPQGQAILAAGKTVYLYAPLDLAQRGLLVAIDNFDEAALAEAPDLGSVENVRLDGDARSGTVRADKGTINLVGAAIRQKGTLTATTAVKGHNGAIFLTAMKDTTTVTPANDGISSVRVANNTGTVELAAGSVTEVLPSVDGLVLTPAQIAEGKIGVSPDEVMRVRDKPVAPAAISSTATDDQKAAYNLAKAAYEADLKVYEALLQQSSDTFYRSRIDIIGKEITLRSGSVVQAPAGEVNILATSNWATSPLRTGQSAPVQDDSRIVMESSAKVDVSGLNNLLLPASRNQLQGRLFSIELADAALQRDGVIYRAELLADARRRITIGDVAGLYNNIRYSAAEYSTAGGMLRMQAQGAMLLDKDALIDFSGGQVTYDAGTLVSSLLLRNGLITRLEDASKDLRYDGLISDPTKSSAEDLSRLGLVDPGATAPTVLESQSVGMSAGVAWLSAPVMSLGATLDGHVTMSETQRLSTDVAERDRAFNTNLSIAQMTDENRVVNRAQALTTQPHLYASLRPTAGLLVLGQHGVENSDTKVPEGTAISSITVTSQAPVLPTLANSWTTESWQEVLSQVGTDLKLAASLINNAGLAGLSLQANTVTVGAADAGDRPTIKLASGGSFEVNALAGIQIDGRITSAGGTLTLKARQVDADVVLGRHAVLDAAGTVRDERVTAAPANDGIARKGGTVTVEAARSLIMAQDSQINVSGAAWRSSAGTLVQGTAGTVSLAINQQYADRTQPPEGTLTLGGLLSGYDFSAGGTLKLSGLPAVLIGGSRESAFSIGTNLFAERGFGTLDVASIGHIDVQAGAQVRPQLVNMVATAARLGGLSALPYELTVLDTGRRQGLNLTLSAKTEPGTATASTFGLAKGANLSIGQGALLDMGIGGSINLSAGGSIEMAGALQALAGKVNLRLLGARGASAGGTDVESVGYLAGQRIHLAAGSLIEVSGTVKSYSADGGLPGQPSREVGEVLAGGTVTLGGSDGTATRGQLIMDEAATIRLNGATGLLDRSALPGKSLISAGAGTLNIMSTDGFQLSGTVEAKAPNASVAGGIINIALSQEGLVDRTDPAAASAQYPDGEAAGKRAIRITGTQEEARRLAASGLKFGEGVVSAELLNGSGFDRIQLRADESVQLNAGAHLVAANDRTRLQSIVLNTSVVDVADGASHLIQAHQVSIGPKTKVGDSLPLAPQVETASKRAEQGQLGGTGTLEVQAGLIELVGNTAVMGVDKLDLHATLSPTASTALGRTNGEIRLVGQSSSSSAALKGQLSFTGDLNLVAGQVYATTLSDFSVKGFDAQGTAPGGKLTVSAPRAGSTSQTPLSALATLNIKAGEVILDGTVRQPFGTIDVQANTLTLTERAALSISGDGTQVPVGSTLNQTSWVYGTQGTTAASGEAANLAPSDNNTVIDLTKLPVNKQITLNGKTLSLSNQASVDVSAGGDILAWEFKQGVGGTTDTFLRKNVFAIVPNYGYDFAPTDAEINATTHKLGSTLKPGDQVTIATSNSVLKAGTYTLMDARYGILPGAVLVSATSLNVTTPMPMAIRNDDGSVIVSGHRTTTGTLQNGGGDQRLALTLEPESTFRKKSEIIVTSGNAYQAQLSNRSGDTLFKPGDAGRVSLVSDHAFDWAARFNFAGKASEALKGGQFDLSMANMVVQADTTQAVPTGAKSVGLAQLNALGADSILLGGTRKTNNDGSITVTRAADSITFQADVDANGQPVASRNVLSTTGELLAVAKSTVTVESGLTLQSTGADTGATRRYVIEGDGAALQVGHLANTDISVTGATGVDQGNLVIGQSSASSQVVLKGNSVQLDATNVLAMAESTDLATRSLSLGGKRVAVGADPAASTDASTLSISGDLLAAANQADRLKLRSYSSIDFHGSAQLGSAGMSSLTLDAPQLLGLGTSADTVVVRARDVVLANSSGRTAPTDAQSQVEQGASSLQILAQPVLRDGHTGGLTIDASLAKDQAAGALAGQRLGFAKSLLESTGDIVFTGRGQTLAQGDLTLRAARVTASSTSDQQADATGTLTVERHAAGKSLNESLGAGGKLGLSGGIVTQNGLIDIEAGRLNLLGRGLAGQSDTVVFATGSQTRVDGRLRQVSDSYAVASGGGQITAEAQTGRLVVDGHLSATAPVMPTGYAGDNPYAGSISLKAASAADGALVIGANADINLEAASGKGGSLTVDARQLTLDAAAQAAASANAQAAQTGLDKLLDISRNASGTGHRAVDVRVRGTDLALNTTVKAAMVALTSDSGKLDLGSQALIDATVPQGGVVQLQAKGDLTVQTGAQVLAQSTRDGANGGDILLSSTDGQVLLGKATIKADSANDAADGRIVIRAGQTRHANGAYTGDVNVGLLPASVTDPADAKLTLQAGQIEIEAVRVYKDASTASPTTWHTSLVAGNSTSTAWGLTSLAADAATFATATNKAKALAKLGLTGRSEAHVKAGVEIQTLGNLTIGNGTDINLSTVRAGTEPLALTVRAAGDLNVNSTISDGFTLSGTTLSTAAGDATSMRFVAGADTSSAKLSATKADASKGHFTLAGGKIIRTTAGSIDVHASGDVRLMAPTLATTSAIYVAGRTSALATNERFTTTGAATTAYANARFTERGGRLTVAAGGNVGSYAAVSTVDGVTTLTPQQVSQMTGNYFYHGGNPNAALATQRVPVAWWTGLNAFRQGFGSFGGGNISVTAGQDISNVAVVAPTNARSVQMIDDNGQVVQTSLKELNGGNIEVIAGRNIDGGVYFLGRGAGRITAGGSLNRGADSVADGTAPDTTMVYEPGTMLGLMNGHWDVSALDDLTVSYVFNPTIMPFRANGSSPVNTGSVSGAASGLSATTASLYFTYAQDAGVSLSSLKGDVNWEANAQALNLMHKTSATETMSMTGSVTSNASYLASIAPPVVHVTSLQGDVTFNRVGLALSDGGSTSSPASPLYVMPSAMSDFNVYADQDVVLQGHVQLIDAAQAQLGLPSAAQPALVSGNASTAATSFNLSGLNTSLAPAGSAAAANANGLRVFSDMSVLQANAIYDLGQQANENVVRVHAGRDIIFDRQTEDGTSANPFLRSNRPTEIVAGRDLINPAFIGQNFTDDDVTIVKAGRDIIGGIDTSSQIVIGGPGALHVEAGRDILLNQSLGVVAVANQINTALPEQSAKITLSAGNDRSLNSDKLIELHGSDPALRDAMNRALADSQLPVPGGASSWAEVSFDTALGTFRSLTDEHQVEAVNRYLNAAFVARYLPDQAGRTDAYYRSEPFLRLKQEAMWQQIRALAGQAIAIAASDNAGEEARRATQRKGLFDQAAGVADLAGLGASFHRNGDIDLTNAKVHNLGVGGGSTSGQVDNSKGGIDVIAAGQVAAGLPSAADQPAGFINFQGGSFRSLTGGDFLVGDQKVIVVGRGNLYIYTMDGDIDSGKGSNTIVTKPTPVRMFDPATGTVVTQGQPPTSGSGLQVVEPPADVTTRMGLYAPNGEIRALDAFVISAEPPEIGSPIVIGADNITGAATSPPPTPNVSLTPKVADTAAGVAQAAEAIGVGAKETSSLLTVDLLGFGEASTAASAASSNALPASDATGSKTDTPTSDQKAKDRKDKEREQDAP
ncbi:filamentous hemagglutinin N-terminal domain-containing protein [Aquabacterium soli]|uniref:Filamentous hemagglutinin N-terminal domain-containing protein n=1 Tax=Aquabacterium soli TaxID=2493092 RepID=A0A3R8U7N4_9BURK|nr:filamentous hemagglutinin N-terminal domain-containing protein [Aquabacterium soli]RRS06340.1 filamentous hemagglutinin N-terminal domain-containing protein [Aquabacterium soli]